MVTESKKSYPIDVGQLAAALQVDLNGSLNPNFELLFAYVHYVNSARINNSWEAGHNIGHCKHRSTACWGNTH
jgi:hypothetical protein